MGHWPPMPASGKLPWLARCSWHAKDICLRLFMHIARRPFSRTACTAGSSSPIMMPMIVITTSNSMRVKPKEADAARHGPGWAGLEFFMALLPCSDSGALLPKVRTLPLDLARALVYRVAVSAARSGPPPPRPPRRDGTPAPRRRTGETASCPPGRQRCRRALSPPDFRLPRTRCDNRHHRQSRVQKARLLSSKTSPLPVGRVLAARFFLAGISTAGAGISPEITWKCSNSRRWPVEWTLGCPLRRTPAETCYGRRGSPASPGRPTLPLAICRVCHEPRQTRATEPKFQNGKGVAFMRWICCVAALAGFCAWPAPPPHTSRPPRPTSFYDYQVIRAYRGQGGTMPTTFAPGPICCESACCCCLHVWDNYCQPKQHGCRFRCGVSASDRP